MFASEFELRAKGSWPRAAAPPLITARRATKIPAATHAATTLALFLKEMSSVAAFTPFFCHVVITVVVISINKRFSGAAPTGLRARLRQRGIFAFSSCTHSWHCGLLVCRASPALLPGCAVWLCFSVGFGFPVASCLWPRFSAFGVGCSSVAPSRRVFLCRCALCVLCGKRFLLFGPCGLLPTEEPAVSEVEWVPACRGWPPFSAFGVGCSNVAPSRRVFLCGLRVLCG